MSKATFENIVKLLQRSPDFQSTGRRPQRAVRYQFGVFLLRYGLRGSLATEPVLKAGIGYGTVFLYCHRVIRVLREIGLTVIAWPDGARKDEIMLGFGRRCGLDGIIGVIDGSLIELTEKPAQAGDTFISRKQFPCVSARKQ